MAKHPRGDDGELVAGEWGKEKGASHHGDEVLADAGNRVGGEAEGVRLRGPHAHPCLLAR